MEVRKLHSGSTIVELRAGQFVRAVGQQRGIGKCLRVSGDEVEIEYFDSISPTGRYKAGAHRSQVKPVQVSPQRRCYWQDETGWRVGRVIWQGDGEYGVRPPGADFDIRVMEEELYVRWNRPTDDPTDVLVAYGNESPYFHLRRHPFLATTIRQRAASHGMHGAISSVIDLHDHQIEVARRVLEDPKERYLLADEVGLGKTIEAGIVIRQYLLDHPDGHVVVIAPPLLQRQWVAELREKFLIDDFDRAVVSVLAHDKPESWLKGASDGHGRHSWHSKAGLIVVDEAHHLAALASVGGDAGNRYGVLAGLTAGVPRLLLLSATPLLNNERTFLAMLHLLDPDIYRLNDIEGFRRRVRDRQALGTAFYTFRPNIPPFLLREKVSTLRSMFPGDKQLGALLERVSEALSDPPALQDTVTAARIHISETYRIHRRLLRTRRSEAILGDFPVRGRHRPVTIPLADPDGTAQEWLDEWRDYIRSTLGSTEAAHAAARCAFIAMAERAGSHPGLVAAAARYRLESCASHAQDAELTPAEEDALSSWDTDPIEREFLQQGSRLQIDPKILSALVSFLKSARRKTIIFTSFAMTARHVSGTLANEFGSQAVAAHLAAEYAAVVEKQVDRFRDAAGKCWILVCDRSAEEGRNFQFADQAIHFDLPFSPNRLEQRIGRLDRYGRGPVIPTYAFEPTPRMITVAWKDCLTDGFGVFDASIASLQFAIDALLPEVHGAALDDGVAGLGRMIHVLPRRLAAEREAIAEQDALDTIETSDRTPTLVSAMRDVEDTWPQIQCATEGLLCGEPGNLRFHRVADQNDKRYCSYRLTAPGKTPHLNSMPLVAWDVLRSRFVAVMKRTGSYSRTAAVARPDARLFRVGEPLVDSLADYVRWDDRGQTFAFWRTSQHIADASLYFRFDYVIEADTEPAWRILAARGGKFDRRALQRRADAYLPPRIVTLWSAVDGTDVDDGTLIALLQAPYETQRGDINLNPERRWALDELIGESDWEWRCRTARARSEEALRRQPSFAASCADAVTRFEEASRAAVTQRRIRLTFLPSRQRAAEQSELAADVDIDAALSLGMQEPYVRLDAIGAVVLSPYRPQGPGFTRQRT